MEFLTFSTLYPNEVQRQHGRFVEDRLRNFLGQFPEFSTTVVAPVPWFPFGSGLFGKYSEFARVAAEEKRYGLDVRHPRYILVPKIGMAMAAFLMALSMLPTLRSLLRNDCAAKFIDAHYLYPDGVAGVLLGKWLKLPVVLTARGSDVNVLTKYRLPRQQILWAARNCSHLITVSESLRQDLIAIGVRADHVTTLRNGVDLKLFTPLEKEKCRDELGIPRTVRLILSVGNLVKLKGHEVLIEALRSLDDNTVLMIVGKGILRNELEAVARSAGVADRVTFVGSVRHEKLPIYYNAADVLAHASQSEGMANVWLEALACGTPVITTNVGGAREVVSESASGSLVEERTPLEFARGINTILARDISPQSVRDGAVRLSWHDTCAGQASIFRSIAHD